MRFLVFLVFLLALPLLAACADPSNPNPNVELWMNNEPAQVYELNNQPRPQPVLQVDAIGPKRLICISPVGLTGTVGSITRQQIIGIDNVRWGNDRAEIRDGCSSNWLPSGFQVVHTRWIQTADGWWVLAQTVRYPRGSLWVTVDPLQAQYSRQPIQYRVFYGY